MLRYTLLGKLRASQKRRQLSLALLTILALGTLVGCDAFFGKSPEEHYQAAQRYAKKGELRASVIELKNTLRQAPQHGEARLLLGSVYLKLGDGANAAKELQRAGELGVPESEVRIPLLRARLAAREYRKVLDTVSETAGHGEDAQLLVIAGQAHAGLGQNRAAESAFRNAIAVDPAAGEAYVGLARIASQAGQSAAAKRYVKQALEADPENAGAWLLQGELAFLDKQFDDAKMAFEKAQRLSAHNDTLARIALARVALAQNKPDEALEQLQVLNKRTPNLVIVQYLRGLAYFQKGDTAASKEALQKVFKIEPNHLPSMFVMGSVKYAEGSLEQAEDLLARFVAAVPNHAPARKLLAQVRLARQRPDDAIDTLAPLSKVSAEDPQLLALMGTAYMRGGEPAKAREYFRQAAAVAPQATGLRTRLALSQLASGETEDAISELERIIERQGQTDSARALLILAHLRARDYDKALETANDLVEQRPDVPLAYNLRGAAYLAKQDVQAARNDFEQALTIDPEYAPAIFNLAQLELRDGDLASARQRYEAILQMQPDNPRALVALARIESDSGNPAEAVRLLEQARETHAKLLYPRVVLADYYLQASRFEDALIAASEADKIRPDDPAVLPLLGRAQLAMGNADKAEKTLRRAAAKSPDSADVHYYLAEAQLRSGQSAAARASYTKALDLSERKQPGSLAGLAQLEALEGNTEAALALAAELQKEYPEVALGYELQGDILANNKQFQSAAEAYGEAIKRAESTQTTVKLAAMQRRSGDAASAEKTLTDWLAKYPDDVATRLVLASGYQAEGKSKEALEQYERVVKVQPTNHIALNNLAWLYYEAGDPRALEMAEAALEAAPTSPAIMDTTGWLRVKSGKVEQGIELLRKAAKGLPGNAEVQYHLGAALAKAGDRKNARKHLEAALASGQHFAEMSEAKQLLSGLE